MTILNFKPFFTFCMAVLAIALLMNTRIVIASTIEPEKLPVQTEIAINSEKDIPRLEWTAGKYLQKGRFQEALYLCRNILDYNEDSLKAKAYLAAAYKGLGDEKNFKNQSDAFKKQFPEYDDLYLGLAWTYSALGEFKKAETVCRQGIKAVSNPQELLMELAGILLRQGKIDEARVQYKYLLTRKNISTNIFLNANFSLCRIGLEKKDFDDVIKRAKTLTDLYSPIPQSYKFLADAYMGKNEYKNAVNTYKKLIAANPKSELPFQEISLIYNDKIKNHDQALSYAGQGVQKFSDNPKSIDILGWILYGNQEYSDALQQFQTAIKISDKNPWFYYHAGMAYQKMENKSKAVENYKKALDLLKDTPAKDFKIQIKKLIAQCR